MRATFTYLIGPNKGAQAAFRETAISVGRAADNMLCLGDGARRVSSHHAEIILRGDHFLLRDLGSTNGTMINGRRVMVTELEQDDLIEFGAGGPLLRFGVAHDTKDEPHPRELHSDGAPNPRPASHPAAAIKRGNATLIAALAVAMLLGGFGGIVASSRLRASDSETLNFAEVAALNSPAVVFIRTEFELLDSSGHVTSTEARTGSGFIVSKSGLIVTNLHLIRDSTYNARPPGTTEHVTKIEVILPHQKLEDALTAEIYKLGDAVDVAVLKIGAPVASFVHGVEANLGETNQGDEVVVIGYPLGLDLLEETRDKRVDPSLSPGIVSRVGQDFIQLNLRAYHGNSGGPVLNRRGDVIGILTGKIGSAQDIALCIPISAALLLVKDELGSPGAQASMPASFGNLRYSSFPRNRKQARMPALPGYNEKD